MTQLELQLPEPASAPEPQVNNPVFIKEDWLEMPFMLRQYYQKQTVGVVKRIRNGRAFVRFGFHYDCIVPLKKLEVAIKS